MNLNRENAGSQLKNRAEGIVHFLHSDSGEHAELANQTVIVDDANLLAKGHGVLRQTAFSDWNKDMTRQQSLADAGSKGKNDRVWTVWVCPVGLHDYNGTNACLFGPARRGEICKPNLTALYCHWISPRASFSS
jgi:hypothetical protein